MDIFDPGSSKSLEQCVVCRRVLHNKVRVMCSLDNAESLNINCDRGQLRDGMFFQCGHVCDCCEGVNWCPICKKKVIQRLKVFLT